MTMSAPRNRQHLVSVGDLVLDILMQIRLPVEAGRHQHTDILRADPGGAGSVMIAARRLGLAVSAIGTVGDDLFGTQILSGLRAEGIDTRGVTVPSGSASTLVNVFTDRVSGEHVFVGHRGAGPIIAATETTRAIIASADALFVDGFALADARTQALAFDAIEQARTAQIPVYFDPGPMLPREQPALARRATEQADAVLLTGDEAEILTDGAVAVLLAGASGLVIVKNGSAGCTIVTDHATRTIAGFPAATIDTVGAGDCFDAAFMAARLNGRRIEDAALLANAAGAASVQKVGAGTNVPTCAEINLLLAAAGKSLRFSCEG